LLLLRLSKSNGSRRLFFLLSQTDCIQSYNFCLFSSSTDSMYFNSCGGIWESEVQRANRIHCVVRPECNAVKRERSGALAFANVPSLFERYNLITIFFNIFFRPECEISGFANIGNFFFNSPASKFFGIRIPFLQNQNIAFVTFPIRKAKFISFFTVQNFLEVFWPNFLFVFHKNMVIVKTL